MLSRFFAQLKLARIAGHPIHSMLIHFPSALFPISLLFDIISLRLQNNCLACAAFYCLGAGLLFGLLAACIGAMDYSRLKASHPAWNKASLHGLLNITWLILFSIVFGLRLKHYPNIELASLSEISLSAVSVLGLIYSNYLGGDLVFRHHLGMELERPGEDKN